MGNFILSLSFIPWHGFSTILPFSWGYMQFPGSIVKVTLVLLETPTNGSYFFILMMIIYFCSTGV
jgi:hypothetical protein